MAEAENALQGMYGQQAPAQAPQAPQGNLQGVAMGVLNGLKQLGQMMGQANPQAEAQIKQIGAQLLQIIQGSQKPQAPQVMGGQSAGMAPQ